MRFKYINVYSADSEITAITRFDGAHIIDMFIRLMKYYDNDCCQMMNICCCADVSQPQFEKCSDGFLYIIMPFHKEEYYTLDNNEKSKMLFELIKGAVNFASERYCWDKDFFAEIFEHMENSGYVNEYVCGKKCKSPDGTRKAFVYAEQTLDITKLYLLIEEKRKIAKKILYKETKPQNWEYSCYVGDIVWTDCNSLIIDAEKEKFEFSNL